MIATGKLRIVVDDFEEKGLGHPDVSGLADAVLRVVEGTDFSVLEIRMVMPSEEAREFLMGMLLGKMELSIEDVVPMEAAESVARPRAEMN